MNKFSKKDAFVFFILFACLQKFIFGQESLNNDKIGDYIEIGVLGSIYSYSEPGLDVKINSKEFGLELIKKHMIKGDAFLMFQGEYFRGIANYNGTGLVNGIPQNYLNLKLLSGGDCYFNGILFSPYIGMGYRNLFYNAANRNSTTGEKGFDRRSSYKYLPIGVIYRVMLDSESIIEYTMEYDFLLSGRQFSGLSILNGQGGNSGISDVNNKQYSGYGINFSVSYKNNRWSVGPYWKYWNIKQSDVVSGLFTFGNASYLTGVYEPKNQTTEIGMKLMYKF